jgi:hypothetical protein
MEMIDLPISERSEYVRFLLTLLVKKYHVNVRALSLDIDIADKVLYKFLHGQRKNLSIKNLDLIESTLIDLYGPLLEIEVRIHQPFVEELKLKSTELVG